MPIEQVALGQTAKYASRTCVAIFNRITKPGSLLVAVLSAAGTLPSDITNPSGFGNPVVNLGLRDQQMVIWVRQNAPASLFISTTALDDDKSQILRVFEISGMSQSNALDKVTYRSGESRDPYSGSTGNTSQGSEMVMGFVANQYASTSQYGFEGNLSRLYEDVSPQRWFWGSQQDWERSRLSTHVAFPTSIGNFSLSADLSTTRRWMAAVLTFRTGISGPLRMSATQNPEGLTTGTAKADLSVFGPLIAGKAAGSPPALVTGTERARIAPFHYQYRIGGWTGLLIGSGTPYKVESTEGFGGFEVRTSDDDLPRNDGALRGVDLSASRQLLFRMNVGRGREEAERNMAAIFRAMVPQREEDFELLFRFPTLPVQMIRCRPISGPRRRDGTQINWTNQTFALLAADPRIYAAVPKRVQIAATPAGQIEPIRTRVVNIGNSPAYPKITIIGTSEIPATRIQLVNETALVNYEAELILLRGTRLEGDMDARIRGVSVSPITLDGQPKYGAWQLPREPFRIDPDPAGFGGYNDLYLRVEPAGATVDCFLDYQDTWIS